MWRYNRGILASFLGCLEVMLVAFMLVAFFAVMLVAFFCKEEERLAWFSSCRSGCPSGAIRRAMS